MNQHSTNIHIAQLEKLYKLPTITHAEKVRGSFWRYAQQKKYFILLAILDNQNRLLIFRDFSKQHAWELAGGGCKEEELENVQEAVQRIARQEIGTNIFDITPLAVVRNEFCLNKKTITHEGIVFLARPVNGLVIPDHLEWGFVKNLPASMFTANKKVALCALRSAKKKSIQPH